MPKTNRPGETLMVFFIATMSVSVFRAGADRYGFLTSLRALGSVAGAPLAAGRERPGPALLLGGAVTFGFGFALAAVMPTFILFGLALVVIGIAAQTFTTTALSTVQRSTEPEVRGRVMAILLAIAMGGTPVGAPIAGRVADTFGPRGALVVGAASGCAAAAVGVYYLARYRRLRVRHEAGRPWVRCDAADMTSGPGLREQPSVGGI